MTRTKKATLAALAAVLGLGFGATAFAGDHGRHHHRHLHHGHHHHGHHAHRHVHRHVVVERPVYVAPPVVYPGYYYAPPVRRPGIVVSVDVPPIVIPLR